MGVLIRILILLGRALLSLTTRAGWVTLIGGLVAAFRTVFPALTPALARAWLGVYTFFSFATSLVNLVNDLGGTVASAVPRLLKLGFPVLLNPFMVPSYFVQIILGLVGKFQFDFNAQYHKFEWLTNQIYRPKLLDSGDALKLWVQGDIDDAALEEVLEFEGYSDTFIENLKAGARQFITVADLTEFANRTRMPDAEFRRRLSNSGVRDDQIDFFAILRAKQIDIAQLIDAAVRGHVDPADYLTIGEGLGYDPKQLEIFLKSAGQPLAIGQMLDLWNRGVVKEDDVEQAMRESNINNKYINWAKQLRYNLLGASDYIRFAVREVFDPTQRQALQLDEDYPEILTKKLEKIGYSPEDAKDAWAAHWDLPSPEQVFRMLHFGVLDDFGGLEYVKKYLKAADYSPEWRDKMIAISYNPLTRVDVRRAFKIGEIGEEDVYQNYLAEGYTPENARTLTNFAKVDILKEKRDEQELLYGPIKNTLLSMYKARRIERPLLEEKLAGMAFTPEQIERFVNEVEFAREVDHAEDVAAAIKSAYVKTQRSRDDTKLLLMSAGYSESMAEQVLEPWDFLRQATELSAEQKQQRDLTKAEILAAYMENLVDDALLMDYLKKLGYDPGESQLIADTARHKLDMATRNQSIEIEHQRFLSGQQDMVDTSMNLDRLGVPATQKIALTLKWSREKRSGTAVFNFAQLKDFFLKDVMPEGQIWANLRLLNYDPVQITSIEKLWDIEKAAQAAKAKGAPTKLTRKDAEAIYIAKDGNKAQALKILEQLGYTRDDIAYLKTGWDAYIKQVAVEEAKANK